MHIKRITVMRMLRKRLRDQKAGLELSNEYEDMVEKFGSVNPGEQYRINLLTDIQQLEFLIWCLKNQEAIENNAMKITMAKFGGS